MMMMMAIGWTRREDCIQAVATGLSWEGEYAIQATNQLTRTEI